MSVVDRTATQDCIKILMSKQDHVTGMETCEFTYEWTMNDIKYDPIRIQSPKFSSHYSDFNDEWILEMDPTYRLINEMRLQQLSADLEKLLLNEKLADVTIKVGQKSFRAIKGILGARSPVFSAMFNHEQLKENKNNEVAIEDIEEDVFEEFLHFIYTGESPNVDKMPMELLAVAEKYQVDCLKNICEEVICESINVDNIASIIVCSDRYNLKKLNKKYLEFMKTNLRDVAANKTFQTWKLLLNEKLADVTIQVGQKLFPAIKVILGARSPVFSAMFDREQLKENKNNEVVIEDIEEDVFEEFLHFIYTSEM
ncbi:speckle-type POZ protein-like B [Aphidius gifuensis]|uniref:speckle-type POZ protein-like B n=1 Tax=Aphidius gifuensis TaxID=684658 RepID=UPI001CDC4DFD|nr:speckle-type POZ protein-like B [Aphidius gifuensis]